MNDIYKRADLLGISVYDLINNYIFIFDVEGFFYGVSLKEDIDKYIEEYESYSDSIILVDLSESIENLQVLQYKALKIMLEE